MSWGVHWGGCQSDDDDDGWKKTKYEGLGENGGGAKTKRSAAVAAQECARSRA